MGLGSFFTQPLSDTSPIRRLPFRGWLTASIGLVGLAFLITLTLQQISVDRPSMFPFFSAIVVAAVFGGATPGLVAAGLSVPAGAYFYTIHGGNDGFAPDNFVMLFFFGICAIVGSILNSQQRAATEALRSAHRELKSKADALQGANLLLTSEVDERRRAERALKETQVELLRVSRLTSMGQLSASIAHEVSQPLAAVVSNAGSCVRWLDSTPPNIVEAQQAARRIVRDVERASDVMNNLRTMVRRGLPNRAPLNLNQLIADTLDLTSTEMSSRGVTLRAELASSLPQMLGDRVQLQQLFLNLIVNALEAFDEASPGERLITIRTHRDDAWIVAEVADSGPGLPGEIAAKAFEAFVSTKPLGMGLGLSICRTIVEGHGGRISYHAEGGAVFRVALPFGDGNHER